MAGVALVLATLGTCVAVGCTDAFERGASTDAGGAGAGSAEMLAGSGGDAPQDAAAGTGSGGVLAEGGVGGAGPSAAGGFDGDSELPDTQPPTIVSVLPANGAAGVVATANIEITFSEPMEKAKTQSAYQSGSTGIKPTDVTFSWNPAGTVLTLKPNATLAYAQGKNPAGLAPAAFNYFVSSAAEDRAGNSLKAAYPVQFTTLRRISQTLTAVDPLSGGYKVATGVENPVIYLWVGCLEADEIFRTFVSFDLGSLPAGIVEFESASLEMFQSFQSSTDRTPYAALGDLEVHSIAYATRNRSAFDALDSPGIQPIAKFGTSAATGYKSVLVTATLAADYEGGSQSQYGIKFHTSLNNDGHHDYVVFDGVGSANPPLLAVTYLVP